MNYPFFFEARDSELTQLEIFALSGYSYAIDRLKIYAKNNPEAAFRLGIIYKTRGECVKASLFFQKAKQLEMNDPQKKYTRLIEIYYSDHLVDQLESIKRCQVISG